MTTAAQMMFPSVSCCAWAAKSHAACFLDLVQWLWRRHHQALLGSLFQRKFQMCWRAAFTGQGFWCMRTELFNGNTTKNDWKAENSPQPPHLSPSRLERDEIAATLDRTSAGKSARETNLIRHDKCTKGTVCFVVLLCGSSLPSYLVQLEATGLRMQLQMKM